MEEYELEPDKIINWANNYADYDELEKTAKSLYSIYSVWRKRDYPSAHKKAKSVSKKVYSKKRAKR